MARAAADEGHLSEPEGIARLGVLVLPSWFGLRASVRELCREMAERGYLALAPGYPYPHTPESEPQARAALAGVEPEHLASLVTASASLAHRLLVPGVRLVAVGFGSGASLALWIAARRPDLIDGVVGFYGSQGRELDDIRGPIQLHLGGADVVVDPEELVLMEADLHVMGKPISSFTYPNAAHGFAEADLESYEPVAAAEALQHMWSLLESLALDDPGTAPERPPVA